MLHTFTASSILELAIGSLIIGRILGTIARHESGPSARNYAREGSLTISAFEMSHYVASGYSFLRMALPFACLVVRIIVRLVISLGSCSCKKPWARSTSSNYEGSRGTLHQVQFNTGGRLQGRKRGGTSVLFTPLKS